MNDNTAEFISKKSIKYNITYSSTTYCFCVVIPFILDVRLEDVPRRLIYVALQKSRATTRRKSKTIWDSD